VILWDPERGARVPRAAGHTPVGNGRQAWHRRLAFVVTPEALAVDLASVREALHSAAVVLDDADVALIESLEVTTHQLRKGELPGGREAFAARLRDVPVANLAGVARYYADLAHLMNVVEEQQRIRVLRAHPRSAIDGVKAAVRALADAGMSAQDVAALLARALVMPVLTAHPTESRRRSTLDHLADVAHCLDEVGVGNADEVQARARLYDAVFAMHATESSRAQRPTVVNEIEATVEVFRRTLLDVTPMLYRRLEEALAEVYPQERWQVPSLLVWGTWVGGDRDGNPNVTAKVSRAAFDRQRKAVLERYLEDVAQLGKALSCSVRRAPRRSARLEEELERERRELPEIAARVASRQSREPWREKLLYMAARLHATINRQDGRYASAAEYAADLNFLDETLRETGYGVLAHGLLADCRRRVSVFGFHLASLDIRQHSKVHEQAVEEILALGGQPGYRGLPEVARRALLEDLMDRPLPPLRDRSKLSAATLDLMATFDVVGRARRELGAKACERWVISFCTDASDLLEVAFLARSAGLAIGELRPVPLLEQLDDLGRAGPICDAIAASPALRAELGDELEVMVGYSDSTKQVGYVTAAIALRAAQLELAAAARRSGMMLTVFHGRGGAVGRGGGPASQAIRAQPAAAVGGRFRVTEQGETITARYARPEIAVRDLELTLGAVLAASATPALLGRAHAPEDASYEEMLQAASDAALAAYRQLSGDERRLAAYTLAATPIQYVANLPIGSRPSSRTKASEFSLADLRAIPWVFSWTQSRATVPGWYGMGSALSALIEKRGIAQLRLDVAASPFLRALVNNAELALVRADIDVASHYARLADPDVGKMFELIAAEHALTMQRLDEVREHKPALADRQHIAESVLRRNQVLDVLCHIQIELQRRGAAGSAGEQADAESSAEAKEVMFATIAGIAAALQTSG
jgi:phosphoenolpyruvate carboxylase